MGFLSQSMGLVSQVQVKMQECSVFVYSMRVLVMSVVNRTWVYLKARELVCFIWEQVSRWVGLISSYLSSEER